ncbi:hypothetical protein HDV64DRAFT_251072 [Trichoderma sp. TUCIM 5745]
MVKSLALAMAVTSTPCFCQLVISDAVFQNVHARWVYLFLQTLVPQVLLMLLACSIWQGRLRFGQIAMDTQSGILDFSGCNGSPSGAGGV